MRKVTWTGTTDPTIRSKTHKQYILTKQFIIQVSIISVSPHPQDISHHLYSKADYVCLHNWSYALQEFSTLTVSYRKRFCVPSDYTGCTG